MASPATRAVERVANRLQRAQLWLAATALAIMMIVTVADVLLRYALNRPIRGSYELVEAMLVVFVFHGIAATFFNRSNIVIDLIDSFVGRSAVLWLARLSDIASIGGLLLLIWAMWGQADLAWQYGDRKLELGLPIWVLWGVALVGMAGAVIAAIGGASRDPVHHVSMGHDA